MDDQILCALVPSLTTHLRFLHPSPVITIASAKLSLLLRNIPYATLKKYSPDTMRLLVTPGPSLIPPLMHSIAEEFHSYPAMFDTIFHIVFDLNLLKLTTKLTLQVPTLQAHGAHFRRPCGRVPREREHD